MRFTGCLIQTSQIRLGDFQIRPNDSETGQQPAYLSAVDIEVNVVLSFVPRPESTGMRAHAIPVAIKPYSIAVVAERRMSALVISSHDTIRS